MAIRWALTRSEGSDLAYVRLHGRNAAKWWDHDEAEDRYDYLYSRGELAPFADRARAPGDRAARADVSGTITSRRRPSPTRRC